MARPYKGKSFTTVDPESDVAGKSVAEWTGEWWEWAVESPAENNPVYDDPTGKYAHVNNDNESVFFIAGAAPVVDDAVVERSFFVPSGKLVLFPILNVLSLNTDPENINDGWYDPVEQYLDYFQGMYATIDKTDVAVTQDDHLVIQQPFELGPVEPGSQLEQFERIEGRNAEDGMYEDSGSIGYWLMLDNLSMGRHTLEFGGYFDLNLNKVLDEGDLRLAVKVNVNVVPEVAAERGRKGGYLTADVDDTIAIPDTATGDMQDALLV